MPGDPAACAHVLQWTFAALDTIEPAVQGLAELDFFYSGERWATEHRPAVVERIQRRLAELAAQLDGHPYLVGTFSAADILMTTVLRMLRHTDLLQAEPVLAAYKERCEARPPFAKALADQMASFG